MKRLICVLLGAALLLTMAGCGAAETPETVEIPATTLPTATEPAELVVSDIDGLLAAIAPDARIVLEAGTYNLSAASDYGRTTESPYYSWTETYDGYELKLRGVENLVIRGSGRETTIVSAEASYANVLTMQNCTGVVLENMTMGHTEQPGDCMGGVLMLQGCMDIQMRELGLYGCGVNGLQVEVCSNIAIRDSDIYDCSSSGVISDQTDGLTVESCRLYNLGNKEYGGHTVFQLAQSTNVEILNCEIRDNMVHKMLNGYPGDSVTFRGNRVVGNRFREVVFDMTGSSMLLEENVFENNSIRMWYTPGMMPAADSQGNLITEEMLDAAEIRTEEDTQAPQRTEVHVSTVDEFLAAIAPDTQIILDGKNYDFSEATGYGTVTGEYYYWEDIFDGPGLVITGVENFGISSNDGKLKNHTLEAVPRYANVLTFSQCSGISLSGFTAGHTIEPGSCTGGVIMLRDCADVRIENCGLYGCGILGVQAEYCEDVGVIDCNIYECSLGGIQMYCVEGVTIDGCTFRELGGDRIYLQKCGDITVDGKVIEETYYSW